MESFTFKNIKRDEDQNDLYNLFTQTYIDKNIRKNETSVDIDEEMRLDKISYRLYGSRKYIEELMQLNNILNVWSIKQGDIIYYSSINDIHLLKELKQELESVYDAISKPKKNTRIDPDRIKFVTPSTKPKNLENLVLDTNMKTITIKGKIS